MHVEYKCYYQMNSSPSHIPLEIYQTFCELASTIFQFLLFSLLNQLIKIKSSYLFLKYPDYLFVAKTPLFHTHVAADKHPFLHSIVFSSSCLFGSIKIYLKEPSLVVFTQISSHSPITPKEE